MVALLILASAVDFYAQQKPSTAGPATKPKADSQLYRNSTFGFHYKVRYGWVERTKEMQEGNDPAKNEILLAVFERPPQAGGDTVNSAVVIASESVSSYPGLKTADDYLAPLNEVIEAKGFKPTRDSADITIDGHPLIRADFTKALTDKLGMHQTTLVMLQKRQIVSFTFIAGTEDEVNDLIDALSFTPVNGRH